MTSTLVSARISPAKKTAVGDILKSLNATTSDLINDAFDYVLATGQLPHVSAPSTPTAEDFASFMNKTTLNINWQTDALDGDYRSLICTGKAADYESLT